MSVHGANRLGTNSLLDLVVFGRAAAQRAAEIVEPGAPHSTLQPSATDPALARFDRVRHAKGRLKTGEIRVAMQRAMQDHCSVFRTARVLEEGLREMSGGHRHAERSRRRRPLADLEHRPRRGARTRQPDPAGGGRPPFRAIPDRKPRRPCPRGLPRARRPQLAQTHPRLAERRRRGASRRPPGAPPYIVERSAGLPTGGARLLNLRPKPAKMNPRAVTMPVPRPASAILPLPNRRCRQGTKKLAYSPSSPPALPRSSSSSNRRGNKIRSGCHGVGSLRFRGDFENSLRARG